ncbi:MAG: hypothetical protein DME99_09270, partial [Verrucomicrobia bacterium]
MRHNTGKFTPGGIIGSQHVRLFVATFRLAAFAITRETVVLPLIRHRAQMRVKRDPVPCPQRMFTVREDLDAREMGSEEFAETGPGEKNFVVALQHVPGH